MALWDRQVAGKIGDNVLYLAHRYHVDLEGGTPAPPARRASLASSSASAMLDARQRHAPRVFVRMSAPRGGVARCMRGVVGMFHLPRGAAVLRPFWICVGCCGDTQAP